MNIIREQNSNLIFIEKDYFTLRFAADVLATDNTSIIYLKNGEKIVGVVSKKDIYPVVNYSFDKIYVVRYNHKPSSEEINNYFLNNPLVHRISVWVNGELYGEYRDIDYPFIPKTIAKNIFALRHVDFFKTCVDEYFKANRVSKIGLIAKYELLEYFKKHFVNYSFELTDYNKVKDYDIVFDFKYGKYLRNVLKVTSKKCFDFSSFLLPLAVKELTKYLELKKVDYEFIFDSVYDGMNCLSLEENEIYKNGIDFTSLLNDESFLKKFCSNDADIDFVKNRTFNKTSTLYFGSTIKQSDIDLPNFKIHNGIRYSGTFPMKYNTELHFYGPCSIMGLCGPDDYTFEYQLQKMLNRTKRRYRVFNHGVMLGDNSLNSIVECLLTNLKSDDFICIYCMENWLIPFIPKEKYIYFRDLFNDVKSKDEVYFFDVPGHCNRKANAIIASYFFNKILSKEYEEKNIERIHCEGDSINHLTENLNVVNPDMYSHLGRLSDIKKFLARFNKIGTVTMYASPFTKGHAYLVKKALEECDAVVIFVVSDNFHTMNSIDRIEIVRRNFQSNDRVVIIPTESYFASKQYFPEYSSKTMAEHLSPLVEYQEMISSKYVYRYLGITNRFLGEEEQDLVTAEYNHVVKKCCEENGIVLTIVPRLSLDGVIISGTESRKAIQMRNFELMELLLPDPTIEYIKEEM